jgi:hypothetical protein
MPQIKNNFVSGMIQDSLQRNQPNSTYRFARNAVHKSRSSKEFGLVNEESNELLSEFDNIVGGLYVESMDATVIFHTSGGGSTISLLDHKNNFAREDIATDTEFGCDWKFGSDCQWINPTVKTMQPCDEPHIYWSAGCDYFTANLAELRSEKRKASLIDSIVGGADGVATCGYSCDHFKLMKCVCTPKMTATPLRNGGDRMSNGIYQFAVQLEDNAGSTTNYSWVTNKISIGSKHNKAGEFSEQSINLNITNLDCKYDKVNIVVVKTVSGVQSVEMVETRHFNTQGINFIYTGQPGEVISLEEITIKKKSYIRGRELTQKDGRLWLYEVRQEKNLNMQARVISEAKLEFVEIIKSAETVKNYNMPSLERGEGYLPAVVYKYCDNTYSPAFLMSISGGGSSGGGSATDGVQGASSDESGGTGSGTGTDTGTDTGSDAGNDTGSDTGNEPFVSNTPNAAGFTEAKTKSLGKFIRRRKNSGLIGPTLPLEDTAQDPLFEQIDDVYQTQDEVTVNIDAWVTDLSNVVESAKCDSCNQVDERGCCVQDENGDPSFEPYVDPNAGDNCVGCNEDENALSAEAPKVGNIAYRHLDDISHMLEGGDTQTKDQTDYTSTTLKGAASRLTAAIGDNERFERTPNDIEILNTVGSTAATRSSSEDSSTVAASDWNDSYTEEGQTITESPNIQGGVFAPTKKLSSEIYPDTKDCNGEFLYGDLANQPVEIFVTPTADKSPFMIPKVSGVPSPSSPNVDPILENDIVLLGIRASGIPIPTDAELSKPLCPNEPYKIVMVPREPINSTVQAKGIFTSTFFGKANGKTKVYARHGLNSFEAYDRFIDDEGSRAGDNDTRTNVYNFHSLDANTIRPSLTGTNVRIEGRFEGQGYRYGLYEEGEKPEEQLTGRRVDQRGARQYINANSLNTNYTAQDLVISGLTYLPADSVVPIPNSDYEFSNRHRESSVAVELTNSIPGEQTDKSFVSDVYNHSVPIISAHAWYGSIIRDIPNQYGNVEGMRFIDTGVIATSSSGTVQGICGDVFIGPYSFRRTGYVSDKVGNTYKTPERDRTVCDSPNTGVTQDLGLDYNGLQVPKDSDITDAKNWAGGHLIGDTRPATWVEASEQGFMNNDIYYPKVVKTLITTWMESRVNPWMRSVGIGEGKDHGEVYYPMLQGMELDSKGVGEFPWEESYLNRYSYEIQQPSKSQFLRKALIKTIVEYIPIAALGTFIEGTDSTLGTTAFFATLPILIAYWYFTEQILSNDQYLDNMLGIPGCATDATGGESDGNIKGFEDNYHAYNYDHSRINYVNYYQSMPAQYNTCECDSCGNLNTTNEIYFSNKQVSGSPQDAYKNYKAFNYLEIPSDSGKLTNLFELNGNFFAHTTDSIMMIKYNTVTTQTNLGVSVLGGNDLVIEPFNILAGITEGFAGLTYTNAAINTKYGYFFIDSEADKIYQYNGSGLPMEISSNGIEFLFKDNLKFCSDNSCTDGKTVGGNHYSLGFDPRYNRILITKQDGENSFTISYDPTRKGGGFISLHDYIPQSYFWDRRDLLSTSDGGVYLHNVDGSYGEFYGEQHPFEIEFTATSMQYDFTYLNTTVRIETSNGDVKNIDDFFNFAAIYNSTEGTGTSKFLLRGDNNGDKEEGTNVLEGKDSANITVNKISKNKYRFNEIENNSIRSCGESAMTISSDCQVIDSINESAFDCNTDKLLGTHGFQDDHLIYRFTYNNNNKGNQIKLLEVITEVTETENNETV